jgi:hypothetical protein
VLLEAGVAVTLISAHDDTRVWFEVVREKGTETVREGEMEGGDGDVGDTKRRKVEALKVGAGQERRSRTPEASNATLFLSFFNPQRKSHAAPIRR